MGAAPSYLARLDRVQARAQRFAGGTWSLESLKHRRIVAGLTYLYKLQCISGPPLLVFVVPLRDDVPQHEARTRAEVQRSRNDHVHRLKQTSRICPRDSLVRAFPNVVAPLWNKLPTDVFAGDMSLDRMQKFKVQVDLWLSEGEKLCVQ